MLGMRFQTKITIVFLALFLAGQGIVIAAIWSTVSANVRDQISGQLAASARVLERMIVERANVLGSRAQDLSKDYGFRQAVATQDQATIESALVNLSARLEADAAFVMDLDNDIVARAGGRAGEMRASILSDATREVAENDGFASEFIEIDGDVFEVVFAPIVAPVTVGWVGLALELDDETALELKAVSSINLDIGFAVEQGGQLRATGAVTNPEILSSLLTHQDMLANEMVGAASALKDEYLFVQVPLHNDAADGNSSISAVLFYSLDEGLSAYKSLAYALATILALGLAFLILGSVGVARGISRPLSVLAEAAQGISRGNYEPVTAPAKDQEIIKLTHSFNEMVSAVRQREEHIRFQVHHDSETGLPNRMCFEEELARRLDNGESVWIGLLEIQEIKDLRTVLTDDQINKLMLKISDRVQQVEVQYLSRVTTETLGFIHSVSEEPDMCAAMVINAFMEPFKMDGLTIDVRACLGMTQAPHDGKDATTLMRRANAALDSSRSASGRHYAWYQHGSDELRRERLSMMSDLRDAINNNQTQFYYQPKLDLSTGRITAVEALVRWISPLRGFVPPDEFIPLAEKTGDVRHLTLWGIETAVKQLALWQKQGKDLAVAINLSANDLMNLTLPSRILDLLTEYSVPARYLKFEVTESALMQDIERAVDVLNTLASMGHVLSIDDYGTGYSSLNYIKSLPVKEIKIDKSFIMKLAESEEDKILVRSTIELAHNLGMEVTAEGVENEASVDLLRTYSCNTLQGYHICRPLPIEEFEKFWNTSVYAGNENTEAVI